MPDQYDRHASSKWEWGGEPSRSQQRAAAASDDPARVPGRKDRWAKCKQNNGGPHEWGIALNPGWSSRQGCGWSTGYRYGGWYPKWSCAHREECTHCGKVLHHFLAPELCPAYPGTEEAKAAVEKKIEAYAQRAARPRKVITGQQGYRKKKAD